METIVTENPDGKSISSSRPANGGERARPNAAGGTDELPPPPGALPDSEYVLSALRCATLRARVAAAELDTIGMALRRNLVSVEDALAWLHDANLFDHVIYRPGVDAH
jgi:hypothetical protein